MPNITINRTLTMSNGVQGVTEWAVWMRTDTGSGYSEYIDQEEVYECPSEPVDEMEVYAFAYQKLISDTEFSIGDKLQFMFVPSGFDLGNGYPLYSEEYTVRAASSVALNSSSGMSMSIALSL